MPRIEVVMDEHRATTRIFERGEYELSVERAIPFAREKEEGGVSCGIMYGLKIVGQIVDGELDETFTGEDVRPFSYYLHSDGGIRMGKSFMIAALGFDDEDLFNEEYGSDPDQFLFDGEPEEEITAGPGWDLPVGKHVKVTLTQRIYQDEPTQEFRNWLPA